MALAEVTFVVDPDLGPGADYASLVDWEAAEATNTLITNDQAYIVKCRSTGGSPDFQPVEFSSVWVTNATHFIKIWTDPSDFSGSGANGTHRHDGKWNEDAYRMEYAGSVPIIKNQYVSHLYLQGLQFKLSSSTVNVRCLYLNPPANSIVNCEQCIVVSEGSGTGQYGIYVLGSGSAQLRNNIVYGFSTTSSVGIGQSTTFGSPSGYWDNNTVVDCRTGYRLANTNAKPVVRNCLAQQCPFPWSGTTWLSGTDFNCSENGTPPGTNPVSYECEFIGVDDFHVTATDALSLLGADLSGTFTVDIDGDTRSLWLIGADDGPGVTECVVVASSSLTSSIVAFADMAAEVDGQAVSSALILSEVNLTVDVDAIVNLTASLSAVINASASLAASALPSADISVERERGVAFDVGSVGALSMAADRMIGVLASASASLSANITGTRYAESSISVSMTGVVGGSMIASVEAVASFSGSQTLTPQMIAESERETSVTTGGISAASMVASVDAIDSIDWAATALAALYSESVRSVALSVSSGVVASIIGTTVSAPNSSASVDTGELVVDIVDAVTDLSVGITNTQLLVVDIEDEGAI